MKLSLTIRSGLLMLVLFIVSSCSSFLDDNINPNLTSNNPPSLILTSIEGSLGYHMGSDLFRYSGLWAQQIAAQDVRQTENYDRYNLQPTEVNNVWRAGWYGGILMDAQELLNKPAESTHPYYFGIAKVIKAFSYSILVDFWGDIPFTEALAGASNTQPAIDDDAAIYPALLTMLDEAIANLKATSPLAAPAGDDYIFTGDAAKWIRVANVLKLRIYLKMANVSGFNTSTISTFVSATPATEFMTTNADDLQMRFESINNRQNPTHQFILSRVNDICTSSTIINLMNSKADPRRTTYFTPYPFSPTLYATPPTGTTGYVGLQNGVGGTASNSLSRLHTFVRGAVTTTTIPAGPDLTVTGLAYNGTAPVNMLTYAEYNFIRAELALRYGVTAAPKASAEEWYQEGIRASVQDAGLTLAQANAYIASNPDGDAFTVGTLHGTTDEQLRQIIEEKYVANFMVAGEPWSDWRRTGYPLLNLLPPALNPSNGGKVPRVLIYPQQEVDANPKMTQRLDMSDRKVFWDTRTTGQE